MPRRVEFVDTSILCNILDVPGKNQHRSQVAGQLKQKRADGCSLILPVTGVIETGNHIAQLGDGAHRRDRAQRLSALLTLVIEGKAPWVLHSLEWGEDFLRRLLSGGDTNIALEDHCMTGLGLGDLCILTEMAVYRSRVPASVEVAVWTLDATLDAHC